MEQLNNLTLRKILEMAVKGNTDFIFREYKSIEPEIEASEFLRYSKEDLLEDSDRGRVNALSNAKRAIDARVDHIIRLTHLRGFATKHRWTFPYKLLVLRKIGIPSPDILRDYISSKRNLLEHEFLRPKKDEIKYLADIVELYLAATENFINSGYLEKIRIALVIDEKELEETIPKKKNIKCKSVTRDEITTVFHIEQQQITFGYKRISVERLHNLITGEIMEKNLHVINEFLQPPILINECEERDICDLALVARQKG